MPGRSEPERYKVRDLVVDVDAAEVTRGHDRLVLPARTLELLVALARRYPAVVRRKELLETVWPDEHVCDETLSHRVMVLRRALGDHSEKPSYVVGERGFGYRLLGPVEALGRSAEIHAEDAAPHPADPEGRPRRHAVAWATILLCALAAASWLVLQRPHGRRKAPLAAPVTVSVRAFAADASVPALPPVAARLTAATMSQLRRLAGVELLPEDRAGAAPELRLEGAVSGTADAVVARLRLVEATGSEIWAQSFRGNVYEVLDHEDTTAWRVAQVIHERLALSGPLPVSPDAASPAVRRLCLRGELAWLAWTEEGLRVADEAWLEAASLAPRQAPAHAGVALVAASRAFLGYGAPDQAEPRARTHALRAMELDDHLPLAQVAIGLVRLLFDRDLLGAEGALHRAAVLDPEEMAASLGLALLAQARGRYAESLAHLRSASGADPHAASVLLLRGRAHQGARQWSEAVAAYEAALQLERGLALARRGLAESLAAVGRAEDALAALRAEGQLSATRRIVHPPNGVPREALHEAWKELCGDSTPSLRERAQACLLAGDRERALGVLEAAVEGRWPFVMFVSVDPLYEGLRGDRRFRGLLAQMEPGRVPSR